MQSKYLMLNVLWFCLVVLYSCSVSIDGAPCNPETNNCPNGQYCSSEGICKRGSPELKDISNIKDTQSYKDIEVDSDEDILNDVAQVEDVSYADGIEDILDISITDISVSDAGCKDECTSDVCKDNSILKVCKDWDGDGCNEYKEVVCGEGAACQTGVCICGKPLLDCNDDMSDGCETNVNTDNKHCGSCTNDCGDNSVCNDGVCGCESGFANCNGKWTDGCEVNLNLPSTCGTSCSNLTDCNNNNWPNVSTYGCTSGSCTIASCNTGYDNCDGQSANGCEVNLNSPNSCGTNCNNIISCGQNSTCTNGVCGCISGYADCNNDWTDGCEVNTINDLNNCGSCGNICDVPNASEMCVNSECRIENCNSPYADCDSQYNNGCEVNLNTDVTHCGSCSTNCNNNNWANVSTYGCASGSCTIVSCETGYADCDNDNTSGCEINIFTDIDNCGSCGTECRPSNVNTTLCTNGLCDYDQCKEFYFDIDRNRANGCEFWSNFPKRYDNKFNSNSLNDLPAVVLKSDNGYLIAGNNASLNQLWIVEVDNYGNIIGQRDIQLKGSSAIKTGIQYLDRLGNLKYLLGGTLKNSNRTDIFLIKFDSKGNLLLTTNYYIPTQIYTFDLSSILYIQQNSENAFALLGSYNNKPMTMFLNHQLEISKAMYYDESIAPGGDGIFSDGYYKDNSLSLTGSYTYKINPNILSEGVLVASYNVLRSQITQSNIITLTDSNLSGNGITPTLINNSNGSKALIVATRRYTIGGNNYNGLLIDYDFSDITNISIKEISDENGGYLSFTKIEGIIGPNNFYLIGGEYYFNSNSDSVLIKLDSNEDIASNIVVGGNKDERFTDFLIDTASILSVSSTSSFSPTEDIMAVRLNSDLEIENARCFKSFAKNITLKKDSRTPIIIQLQNFEKNDIQNLTTGDPLNSITPSNGEAYNICAEPK